MKFAWDAIDDEAHGSVWATTNLLTYTRFYVFLLLLLHPYHAYVRHTGFINKLALIIE
jgi:hypothetical protein